jgi:hypothetical protein
VSATACRFSSFILIFLVFAGAARGQSRIAFPTMIATEAPAANSGWTAAPAGGTTSMYGAPAATNTAGGTMLEPPGLPGTTTAPPTTFSPAPATSYGASARTAVAPASAAPQTYVSPGTGYGPPGSVSPFNPNATMPPPGSYGGALPPPAPGLDPYATPGTAPAPLFPGDPYFNYGASPISMQAMTKFLQDVRLDYHWFLGHGPNELGINDFDLSATFAIPFLGNPNTPLLVTPGFGLQLWEGPVSVLSSPPNDPAAADLPNTTYDGYIDTAWKPQISQSFSGDLSFRVGLYSDFTTTTTQSIRFTGTALGVIQAWDHVKIKAGIWYIDRLQIKLLPAGGIVWTPNPEWEFDILFPNPKIRMHWQNFGSADWWIYAAGDYGGGSWTIKRANVPGISDPVVAGQNDAFDYDDIRVSVGMEFLTPRKTNGWFEIGGAFSRQLHYRSGLPDNYYPNNALFLRAGLAF